MESTTLGSKMKTIYLVVLVAAVLLLSVENSVSASKVGCRRTCRSKWGAPSWSRRVSSNYLYYLCAMECMMFNS
ncbi:hypothetical protein ACROYT_G024321 [Oculina patagonica]